MHVVSQRIIGARSSKGLTQEELAESVGVSLRTVQNWEKGTYEPQGKNLRSLSEVLGQTIPYLMGGLDAVQSVDQGMRVSETPQTIAHRCHEYLEMVLNQYQGDSDRQSWVLVELQRKFPVETGERGPTAAPSAGRLAKPKSPLSSTGLDNAAVEAAERASKNRGHLA